MNIMIASIENTGGEWLERAVKAICTQHGSVYSFVGDFFDASEAGIFDYVILNLGDFIVQYAYDSVIITTSRCPSQMDFKEYTEGTIINQYYQQSLWNEYTNKCIKYDTIINDELLAIQEVAFALNLKCSSKEIQKIINNEESKEGQKRSSEVS